MARTRRLTRSIAALAAGLVCAVGAGAPAQGHDLDRARGVPGGLQPASTSWTSPETGWVLGWTPCDAKLCATLLHTTDGGKTWSEEKAPPIRPSEIGEQTRVFFAESRGRSIGLITNGSALFVTYDAGRTWNPLRLPGSDVVGGIGSNDRSVFLVGHSQVGPEVRTQAFSASIDHPRWHDVRGVSAVSPGSVYSTVSAVAGSGRSVQISTSTYDGLVRLWTAPQGHRFDAAYPCNPRAVMYPGLGAGGQQFVLCSFDPGRGRMFKELRTGSAADRFERVVGTAPLDGLTTDFTVAPDSTIAVGATEASAGLVHQSFDGGQTWQTTLVALETGPIWDLSFQDAQHGVLVAGHGTSGWSKIYRTTDGGRTWVLLDL